ncbi:hypothetical protein [Effusibacillus pohliae]|uniref:hypothetical protein n=1 Tax=Effusibacillus pohliae TaxID=232270 RepID=UPI000377F880|nr:hypothetical protein [Effusibacillus pohliae]
MICQECGKDGAATITHLPLPDEGSSVELFEAEVLCSSCLHAKTAAFGILMRTYTPKRSS